jgi:hypothetical protein
MLASPGSSRAPLGGRGGGETMSEYSAIELPEAIPAPLTTTFLSQVRSFVTGALFTAAVIAAGAVLVTIALTVGVVASPLVFLAVLYLVVRRRRVERLRWTALRAT